MKKVIITQLGASLKCNPWKEGEIIEVTEVIANHFIAKGFAEEIGTEKKEPIKNVKKKWKK